MHPPIYTDLYGWTDGAQLDIFRSVPFGTNPNATIPSSSTVTSSLTQPSPTTTPGASTSPSLPSRPVATVWCDYFYPRIAFHTRSFLAFSPKV